ncbi:MAG: NBR1-Ig-like domain-containing protein [Anaerolineaceae bacterium]
MRSTLRITAFLTILMIFLSACNLPVSTPTLEPEAAKTAAAQTVNALRTQIAGTMVPTLSQAGTATQAAAASQTSRPTNAPPTSTFPPATSTMKPSSTPIPTPCDRLQFVADLTIADDTVIGGGSTFTKTWRIQNTGSCSWTSSYKLVYVSGDQMNGATSTALPGNVNPGGTVDLTVTLTAPAAAGTYQGFWKLQNPSGGNFGFDPGAGQSFWVKIKVGSTATPTTPTAAGFVITSVQNVSASPNSWNAACPYSITLSADVTASAAGTATYYWVRSTDNAHTATGNIAFASAGTTHVTYTLTGGVAGDVFAGTYSLYIDNPNHQQFGGAAIAIACP